MRALARVIDGLALASHAREQVDPANRHPKEEPCKRYLYDKTVAQGGAVPYRTEKSEPDTATRLAMAQSEANLRALSLGLRVVRGGRGRSDLDDHLVNIVQTGRVGFGF